jgi:hypothetical protein
LVQINADLALAGLMPGLDKRHMALASANCRPTCSASRPAAATIAGTDQLRASIEARALSACLEYG